MTTVVWHMITLGLLFWTSSSAERNIENINEATDDLTNDERQYHRSEQNHLSLESQPLNAREPYSIHERTVELDGRSRSADYDLHLSASPRHFETSPVSLPEQSMVDIDDRIHLKTSKLQQLNDDAVESGAGRNIDGDNVDLVEPKNDIDLETKQLTNDKILETAHEITGIDYYDRIKPTRTKLPQSVDDEMSKSEMVLLTSSGEDERASSRGRSLPLTKPSFVKSVSNASAVNGSETAASARSTPDDRQSNSDIQNIIDGFVKLLNGNVQVQVNTNGSPGKPSFPSRTRINNRGPPRITDVPPIIFEPPGQVPLSQPSPQPAEPASSQPAREPPPYPFDIPQSLPAQPVLRPFVAGVPLPEQIVPTNSSAKHTPANHTAQANESSNYKESAKIDKEKLATNLTGMSTIEKVNRTQIKSTSTPPLLAPVFVSSRPLESKTNATSLPQDNKVEVNESKIDSKLNKGNVSLVSVKQSTAKSTSVPLDIQPSTTLLPPLRTSSPPAIKSDISDTLLPTTGVGTAMVVLEPSTQEVAASSEVHKASTSILASTSSIAASSSNTRKRPTAPTNGSANGYFPRPGIVLDDPEYKPGAHRRPPPIISAPPAKPSNNRDIFDVTVSAIQGTAGSDNSSKNGLSYVIPDVTKIPVRLLRIPYTTKQGTELTYIWLSNAPLLDEDKNIKSCTATTNIREKLHIFEVDIDPAHVDPNHNEVPIITNPQVGQNFVSIDGKRTYLNLFDSTTGNTGQITPTLIKNYPGTSSGSYSTSQVSPTKSVPTKSPPIWKKPTHPPVRIDTCIVGDDSTCDSSQHERCRTEVGVSSCHCRPGYTRRKHREPCHRVVSLFLSLRVDRLYDQHLSWNDKLAENDSAEYQQLEYEAGKAIDSALSMTPFSDVFMGAKVNNIYTSRNSNIASPVFINMTVQLAESQETLRPPVKQDLQKQLMGVIQRRSNNIGSSALFVDNPNGVVSQIHDVDECSNSDLNDCHPAGKCTNVFGSFHCTCPEGSRDPWTGNSHRSGRTCETCDAGYCNHRGDCSFHNGQPVCRCTGSYYGAQCEIDGEVLGVAVGSSLVAILIIITTLACLCAWSRRWNKEQKIGSPIFGYMPSGGSTVKTPVMGAPPYQVSLEDRIRWAHIADAMAHANHYGPEPVNGPTRPSSTIFGYTLPHSAGPVVMPRLRPPSVHTLRTPESSTSEEEDRADLLGRNFQVPRPKSRSSIANQSGIYYDVDYDSQQQSGEIFSTIKSGQPPCIPLNTYTMGSRSHYFNFRS